MAPQLVSSQSKSEAIAHNVMVEHFFGDGPLTQKRVELALLEALTKYNLWLVEQLGPDGHFLEGA